MMTHPNNYPDIINTDENNQPPKILIKYTKRGAKGNTTCPLMIKKENFGYQI